MFGLTRLTLTRIMEQRKQQWHFYENKQERPIKVMTRNLHPTCSTDDIVVKYLKTQKFKILKANQKQRLIYLPLHIL